MYSILNNNMEFELPANIGFTIYSKPGCLNCNKIKILLKEKKIIFKEIMCDEYLLEYKEEFLEFIKNLSKKECKIFPIIFFDDKFVGGYDETLVYIEKLMLTFEDNLVF
jgi:glutaredoxin